MESNINIMIKQCGNAPRYTREEEVELCKMMRDGCQESRLELFNSCTPWAIVYGKKFYHRYKDRQSSLTLDESTQAALIGLNHALDKFEPGKGRLTTYSAHWMFQYCMREMQNNKLIYIPSYRQSQENMIDTPSTRLMLSLNVLLSKPMKYSDELLDVITNNDDDRVERYKQIEQLGYAMKHLMHKERDILRRRFTDGDTLLAIGKDYGVTKERIRQIQNLAIGKLRLQLRLRMDGNKKAG